MPFETVIVRLLFRGAARVTSEKQKKEDTRMSSLAKLVSIIGALLFFTLVVVVGLAFVDYIQSGHEKTVRGESRRRSLP